MGKGTLTVPGISHHCGDWDSSPAYSDSLV